MVYIVSSPQIFRILRRNGFFSLLIEPSQKFLVFAPFTITYPSLSILISLSDCHSPSILVQSRDKNSISSNPSELTVIGLYGFFLVAFANDF